MAKHEFGIVQKEYASLIDLAKLAKEYGKYIIHYGI